jgi:hypothetical protein
MNEDLIQKIWDKGKPRKRELSVQEVERALRPDVRRQSFALRTYVWIYLVILSGTLILDALNIVGYSANPVMLMTQIGLTLLGVTFGMYGIHLLREIRIMDRADESLLALLQRRLRFYRTKFRIWEFLMAATIVLATFAVTSYVDNEDGFYRIHRVGIFILFSVGQFAFMYGVNKIAQYPIRKEMKVFLADLEANVTQGRETLVASRKRWRIGAIIFFIIGTILLVLGILRTMQFGR